ncbi:MurR/RpiR family transcriptional regulator [Nocardiopsis composta]
MCRLLTSHPAEQLLYSSAQELGAASGTSNASVIRTLRRLGYSGLPALKQAIAAPFSSSVAPEVRLRERIERLGGDLAGIWDRVADEARERIEHARAASSPATSSARWSCWPGRGRPPPTGWAPPGSPRTTWR